MAVDWIPSVPEPSSCARLRHVAPGPWGAALTPCVCLEPPDGQAAGLLLLPGGDGHCARLRPALRRPNRSCPVRAFRSQ